MSDTFGFPGKVQKTPKGSPQTEKVPVQKGLYPSKDPFDYFEVEFRE